MRSQELPGDQGMGVGCAVRASCPSPSLARPLRWDRINITSLLLFLSPATTGASCTRSNAIGTWEMLEAAPALCMRADNPGTLCPKLEPLSHPELSIEGCREQVSKATAVNSPPQSGLYKPSRFRGWMRSLPGTGALFAEGTHHFEIHPALPGCQRAAPAPPRGRPRHHQLYFTVTALPRARGCK